MCQRIFYVEILTLFAVLFVITNAGVPFQRYEALMKKESEDLGLYNASDKVIKLTETNFNESVLEQNHSSLVEFYNSYCGHCRRFAPVYKQLAEQLEPWKYVITINAIDCASEENNDVCRQYEVMGYPTLRYMGPGFQRTQNNFGSNVDTQDPDEIRTFLATMIASENRTAHNANWPNFHYLTDNDNILTLFEGLGSQRQYVAIVQENDNSTVAIETILFLLPWPSLQVRRISEPRIFSKFNSDGAHTNIIMVDRKGTTVPLQTKTETSKDYAEAIAKFLQAHHITPRPLTHHSTTQNAALLAAKSSEEAQNNEIISEVKRNKHFVYQADLELAIHSILFNEVPKVSDISGERLLALQRFLAVLQRYNPLGSNGRTLVRKLNEYVVQHNQQLTGKAFQENVTSLELKLSPIFSAKRYIGCTGSRPTLRGFTCSLWQLFHFMTVQAARNEETTDPLEVLQAMHGFVKYFFGCTDCSQHFQEMATRRKIWSVPNKDEAIIWLWAAHNEVNNRLAGDSTEDPKFPKIQFPSETSCAECHRSSSSSSSLDTQWNKDAVLRFMKNIYNPEYISRYGLQREDILPPTLEKIRQKRQIANVFSDMDMRMGMLLYGFCIVMMVIAFKLFAFKGYRKKPYSHDLLGKV